MTRWLRSVQAIAGTSCPAMGFAAAARLPILRPGADRGVLSQRFAESMLAGVEVLQDGCEGFDAGDGARIDPHLDAMDAGVGVGTEAGRNLFRRAGELVATHHPIQPGVTGQGRTGEISEQEGRTLEGGGVTADFPAGFIDTGIRRRDGVRGGTEIGVPGIGVPTGQAEDAQGPPPTMIGGPCGRGPSGRSEHSRTE